MSTYENLQPCKEISMVIQIKIFVFLKRYTLENYVIQTGQQKSKTSFKLFLQFEQDDFSMAMKQIFDKVNPQ